MKCPACKKEDTITGTVTVSRACRLVKGGGLDFAGVSVKQSDMKTCWEESKKTVPDSSTGEKYNEVYCTSCAKVFWYIDGKGLTAEGTSHDGNTPPATEEALATTEESP